MFRAGAFQGGGGGAYGGAAGEHIIQQEYPRRGAVAFWDQECVCDILIAIFQRKARLW